MDGQAVSRGKPNPEGYLLAAHQLGARPADCLVVEDAPAGIQAARGAGMPVIALSTSHPAEQLQGADAIVGSLGQARSRLLQWMGLTSASPQ